MPTTTFLAATTGQPPLAQHINQLLTTHPTQFIYTGTSQASVVTSGATTTGTNSLWLAQSFTTGASQTAIGYAQLALSTTATSGATLAPTTVSIYTNNAGAPGVALVSATVTAEFANLTTGGGTNVFTTVPLPVTGLTAATQYWIVVQGTASSGQFTLFRSASASGASTSPTGSTWTAQTYGFRYNVFDQSTVAPLVATWEDSGQRWQLLQYNASLEISNLSQYTGGQTTAGYQQEYRTLTYSNGLPQGAT